MANGNNSNGAPKPVRCAIYTRTEPEIEKRDKFRLGRSAFSATC